VYDGINKHKGERDPLASICSISNTLTPLFAADHIQQVSPSRRN
jgi:hypothetical protein